MEYRKMNFKVMASTERYPITEADCTDMLAAQQERDYDRIKEQTYTED